MRGHTTTQPVLNAQAVAIRVNLAFKDAGFKATPKDLGRARYAFAERITKRAFVVSFTRFSETELREVYNAADEPETVRAFLKDFELERYRQHARRIVHPHLGALFGASFMMFGLNEKQRVAHDKLVDGIAQALKETAYATRPR